MRVTNKEQFLSSLKDTIEWCKGKVDVGQPKVCLRSDRQREIILSHGEDPDAIWISSQLIADVLIARGKIKQENVEKPLDGRVLFCAYDYTNHNGLTDDETDGYFDEHDSPPWDTWICEIPCNHGNSKKSGYGESWPPNITSIFSEGGPEELILAAWVPSGFIDVVQQAIDIECCGMIFWADSEYPESPLSPKYQEVIPQWLKEMYIENS